MLWTLGFSFQALVATYVNASELLRRNPSACCKKCRNTLNYCSMRNIAITQKNYWLCYFQDFIFQFVCKIAVLCLEVKYPEIFKMKKIEIFERILQILTFQYNEILLYKYFHDMIQSAKEVWRNLYFVLKRINLRNRFSFILSYILNAHLKSYTQKRWFYKEIEKLSFLYNTYG